MDEINKKVKHMKRYRMGRRCLLYTSGEDKRRKRGRPPITWIEEIQTILRGREIEEDLWMDKEVENSITCVIFGSGRCLNIVQPE